VSERGDAWANGSGAKSFEHFVDVAWHRDRDQVGIAFRFDSEFVVVRAKSVYKVVSIVLCAVTDAEIVDHETEHDITRFVFEEARGIGTLMVSVFL
jgi:hypothetical protein